MKIGIFTDSYLPAPTGVAVSVETFRQSLVKLGHEVFIFAPKFKNYREKTTNIFRFPAFFLPVRKDAPIVWPIINPNFQQIEKLQLDIIHTMHFFSIGSFGLKVAKRFGLPLVHTYHTNYQEYVKSYVPLISSIAGSYMIYKSRKYCNQCDLIISPSPSMAKIIKSYGIKSEIEPLPTGIETKNFFPTSQEELRKKYAIRSEGKLLLFVGRLGEEKNITFLLESFLQVIKKVDVNLILVGSGPSIEKYKNFVIDHKVEKKVYFLGFLPKKETNIIFGACDLFVFPSITDTQGIVIVEAMAAGLVPVAMNKLGPSDIITDEYDGLLSDLNKIDFQANIIELLTNNNLRQRLAKNALKTAQKYSQDKIVEKLVHLYEKAEKNHQSC